MKVIIVDDEPKAIELLRSYLNHFNKMELVGTFRNGLKAFEYLNKNSVDLIFLDINMPHISGISLSKMIPPTTKIIFTTAYSEYAVESYEVEATDYLLKPISLERFTKAVSKVLKEDKSPEQPEQDIILIKSGSTVHRINPQDIHYIEKEGNYATYYTSGQKIVSRESTVELLANLPSYFIQVHKSYVVNTNKVSSIEKDRLKISEVEIPVGSIFKAETLKVLFKDKLD